MLAAILISDSATKKGTLDQNLVNERGSFEIVQGDIIKLCVLQCAMQVDTLSHSKMSSLCTKL